MTLFKYNTEYTEHARVILQMLADGFTMLQIGRKLQIHENHIESLVEKMRRNTQSRSTTVLIVKAMREGLVR